MQGILELFAEYSQPDEFTQQAQLELFAWRYQEASREVDRRRHFKRRPYFLAWQRQDRARKAAEGVVCSRCARPRVEGKASCEQHLRRDRERIRRGRRDGTNAMRRARYQARRDEVLSRQRAAYHKRQEARAA